MLLVLSVSFSAAIVYQSPGFSLGNIFGAEIVLDNMNIYFLGYKWPYYAGFFLSHVSLAVSRS